MGAVKGLFKRSLGKFFRKISRGSVLRLSYLVVTAGIFLFAGLVLFLPLKTSFLNPVSRAFNELHLSDLFLKLNHTDKKPESNEITVVDVTSVYNRSTLAEIIAQIGKAQPEVIALDLIFREDDRTEDNRALKLAVDTLSVPLVAAFEVLADGSYVTSFFASTDTRQGYVNTLMNNTYSQCLRTATTTPPGDRTIRSFPLQVALASSPELAYTYEKELLINFSDVKIPVINYKDIKDFTDRLQGKIVIIGAASGREDLHLTPVGDLSGPEIAGLSIYTLLHDRSIRNIPTWVAVLLALILTYLYVIYCSRLFCKYQQTSSIRIAVATVVVLIILTFINLVSNYFFRYNIDFIYTFVGIVLTGNAISIYRGIVKWLESKGVWVNHLKKLEI